jgi:hypothetical protein
MSDQAIDRAQVLYECLRAHTAQSKVTGKKQLLLHPPEGLDKEELSALLAQLGTPEVPEALRNVAVLSGRKDQYYYDSTIMTRHYAEIDTLLQEKDILRTIASVTRSDSNLYPRPTQFSKLQNVPFRFSRDELLGAAARMRDEPEYHDIGLIEASNGAKAFFSTKYLTKAYAQSLLEWIEVEEPNNP